jgi:hypothetical protein
VPQRRYAFEHHFGVALTAEAMTGRFELGAKLEIVVDLAVEGDRQRAARVVHRLMPARREIDDGQTTMPERDRAVGSGPCAAVIGTAMRHRVRHRAHDVAVESSDASGDAAHSAHVCRFSA